MHKVLDEASKSVGTSDNFKYYGIGTVNKGLLFTVPFVKTGRGKNIIILPALFIFV